MLKSALARYGCLGLLTRLFTVVIPRRLLAIYRRLFRHCNLVLQFDPASPELDPVPGLTLHSFDGPEAIPPALLADLLANHGPGFTPVMEAEFGRSCRLWVATIDGQAVGSKWTRRGRHFTRWFIPLEPDDLVIFGVIVFPRFRGRRISPYMTRRIVATELAGGGRAFCDVAVWNRPSLRAFARAGFTREVARGRPRSDLV